MIYDTIHRHAHSRQRQETFFPKMSHPAKNRTKMVIRKWHTFLLQVCGQPAGCCPNSGNRFPFPRCPHPWTYPNSRKRDSRDTSSTQLNWMPIGWPLDSSRDGHIRNLKKNAVKQSCKPFYWHGWRWPVEFDAAGSKHSACSNVNDVFIYPVKALLSANWLLEREDREVDIENVTTKRNPKTLIQIAARVFDFSQHKVVYHRLNDSLRVMSLIDIPIHV